MEQLNRRRFLQFGTSALALGIGGGSALLSGCSASTSTGTQAGKAVAGGTLIMAEPDVPNTLNFLTSTLDVLRHTIRSTVLDTLVHAEPDLSISPGLAKSWSLSADAKTLTMVLRPNLKFHDGSAFTAADVAYTVDWVRNASNGSPLSVLVAGVETVQAVDTVTARFQLSAPTPSLLANLTQLPMFSAGTVSTMDSHPIGLGPFKFASYQSGDSLSVVKNPDYYMPGLPLLDGITWKFITDAQASLEDLLSGNVLAVDSLAVENAKEVSGGSTTYMITSKPVNLYEVFQINTKRAPFDNKLVRQALSYAMNRDAYTKAFWYGYAQPSDTPFVSEMSSYLAGSSTRYAYNLTKAASLLAQAGFSRANPLTVDILNPTGFPTMQAMALTLQSSLNSLGHKVTVTNLAVAPWIDQIVTHPNFDITTDNYNTLPIDPGSVLTSSNYSPASNVNQFAPAEYTQLISEATAQPNAAKRLELYDQIQSYLLDEQPCIIVDHYPVMIGASSNVKGLVPGPIGPYDYTRTTIG